MLLLERCKHPAYGCSGAGGDCRLASLQMFAAPSAAAGGGKWKLARCALTRDQSLPVYSPASQLTVEDSGTSLCMGWAGLRWPITLLHTHIFLTPLTRRC